MSVLIPTYNYGRYIWQAIESVLAQDFTDFEIIVSDDASNDDTAAIVRAYAACDRRIRLQVHPVNLGMVANWNWCLSQARGDYVKFVFGDDCLTRSDALGRLVAALDREPQASLVTTARLLINEQSEPTGVWDDIKTPGTHQGIRMITRCMQEDRNLIGEPSAVLFRREHAARGFDPALRQVVDQEFWFHLLLRGDLVYLPEPLCAFRQHATQQTKFNATLHLGPRESLHIVTRYLDGVSNPSCGGFRPLQRRCMIYRRLHYSRKNVPRSAGILVVEAAMQAQLSPPWYALMWLHHRVTKPFHNLHRYVRRHLRQLGQPPPAQPLTLPPIMATLRHAALRQLTIGKSPTPLLKSHENRYVFGVR